MNRVYYYRFLHPVRATRDFVDYVIVSQCKSGCHCASDQIFEILAEIFPGTVRIPTHADVGSFLMGYILIHLGNRQNHGRGRL